MLPMSCLMLMWNWNLTGDTKVEEVATAVLVWYLKYFILELISHMEEKEEEPRDFHNSRTCAFHCVALFSFNWSLGARVSPSLFSSLGLLHHLKLLLTESPAIRMCSWNRGVSNLRGCAGWMIWAIGLSGFLFSCLSFSFTFLVSYNIN